MELNSNINNLTYALEDDIRILNGNNDFSVAFNTNQISKIEKNSRNIKIYIDLDLVILIQK